MTKCTRYTEKELQQLLSDGIAELQRENAELKKDKARLDWMTYANNTIGNVTLPRNIVEGNLHILRSAIDEAMVIDNLRRMSITEAELVELRKDKARLDWLADENQNIGDLTLPRDIVERNLHSMRAAIDEAMAVDGLGRVDYE